MEPTRGKSDGVSAIVRVERLLEVERYDLAEREARAGLADVPDDAELLVALGRAQMGREDIDGATDSLEAALERDPDNPLVHSLLALIDLECGRLARAESTVLEALRLNPSEPFFYRVYARITFAAGQLEKAEKLLDKSLELDPTSEDAHGLLAQVRSEMGESREAISLGYQGLALAPDDDGSHRALGIALFESGRPFAARKHLREAVRIDPDDAGLQEAFAAADLCCRWVYLPQFYTWRLIDRLPGKQFTLWAIFLVLVIFMRESGEPTPRWLALLTWGYLGWVVYSWIAEPLARLWVRMVPAR